MIRKIIKQGNKSYTFTLPIDWIKEYNLKGSDEIEIIEDESSLIITPKKKAEDLRNEIVFDLQNFGERAIRNIINQAYRQGYDKITLHFHSKQQIELINDITENSLLGFAVVEEKNERCVLQNIAEPSKDRYDIILRRVFLTIKIDSEEILSDFQNGNQQNMEKRIQQKNVFDKYTNYLRRVILSHKIGGRRNSYLLYHLISQLSVIYHTYYYLSKTADKMKIKTLEKDVEGIFVKVNDHFMDLYHEYFNNDLNLDYKIGMQKIKIFEENIYPLMTKNSKQNVIVYHLGEITRLVQLSSSVVHGMIANPKKDSSE